MDDGALVRMRVGMGKGEGKRRRLDALGVRLLQLEDGGLAPGLVLEQGLQDASVRVQDEDEVEGNLNVVEAEEGGAVEPGIEGALHLEGGVGADADGEERGPAAVAPLVLQEAAAVEEGQLHTARRAEGADRVHPGQSHQVSQRAPSSTSPTAAPGGFPGASSGRRYSRSPGTCSRPREQSLQLAPLPGMPPDLEAQTDAEVGRRRAGADGKGRLRRLPQERPPDVPGARPPHRHPGAQRPPSWTGGGRREAVPGPGLDADARGGLAEDGRGCPGAFNSFLISKERQILTGPLEALTRAIFHNDIRLLA